MEYKFKSSTRFIRQPDHLFVYNINQNQYHLLNEGAMIYVDLFNKYRKFSYIVDIVSNEYEVEKDEIEKDLNDLLKFFSENKYLTIEDGDFISPVKYECNNISETKLLRAQIQITNKCNQNCKYCFAEPNTDLNELEINEWVKILGYWWNQGLRVLTLTGGEPFIRNDIFELLNFLNNQFIIVFNTNATLLTEKIVKKLIKYNIKSIMVSLDSLSSKKHNKYRGQGSWEKTMQGINILNKYKLPISISTTFTEENETEIDDIINFCRKNNFEFNPDIIINLPENIKINEPKNIDQNKINTLKQDNEYNALNLFNIGCQATIGYANFSHNGFLKPCDISDNFFNNISTEILFKTDYKKKYHETELYKLCNEAEAIKSNNNSRCIYNCNLSKMRLKCEMN